MKVKIYVEGGGDRASDQSHCRKGFRELIEKMGFRGRMPAIVASGGRDKAYKAFEIATTHVKDKDTLALLLVDSEEPLVKWHESSPAALAWDHVKTRDNWVRPHGVDDDQLQLMVTCMETWIMADQETLKKYFGRNLHTRSLLFLGDLESQSRHDVKKSLEDATRDCGEGKKYAKGRRSFEILSKLDPNTLELHLSYFRRFKQALNRFLE